MICVCVFFYFIKGVWFVVVELFSVLKMEEIMKKTKSLTKKRRRSGGEDWGEFK